MRGVRIRDGRPSVLPIASFCASTWFAFSRLNTSSVPSSLERPTAIRFSNRISRNLVTVSVRSTPRGCTQMVSEPCGSPAIVIVRVSGSPARAVYFPDTRT